jgi:hypothetical protein
VDLAKLVGGGPEALDTEGGKKSASALAASARANPIWPEWRNWRTEQINTLAREIRAALNKVRPSLPISSYVWGYNTYTSKSEVCQDWVTWINEGMLDWINPSGYRYTDATFLEAARLNRSHVPSGFPFYITIGVKTSHGALKDAAEIRKTDDHGPSVRRGRACVLHVGSAASVRGRSGRRHQVLRADEMRGLDQVWLYWPAFTTGMRVP